QRYEILSNAKRQKQVNLFLPFVLSLSLINNLLHKLRIFIIERVFDAREISSSLPVSLTDLLLKLISGFHAVVCGIPGSQLSFDQLSVICCHVLIGALLSYLHDFSSTRLPVAVIIQDLSAFFPFFSFLFPGISPSVLPLI